MILPMLNHLIIKSLSPDVDLRPSITWISVLLKNYLEILPWILLPKFNFSKNFRAEIFIWLIKRSATP